MFSECLSTVKLQPLRSQSLLYEKLTFFSCNSPGQRPIYWCMILKFSFPLTFYKCSAIFVSLLTPSSLGHNVPRQILRQYMISHARQTRSVSKSTERSQIKIWSSFLWSKSISLTSPTRELTLDIYQIKVGGA